MATPKSSDGFGANEGLSISRMEIFRDVVLAVLGSDVDLQQKPILIIAHFGVILQLICHMPFIFFIGKEHIL